MTPPRPPSLADILGQERALALLRAAVSSGRIHHAWIFVGPRGVGKRTAAEAFAALILDPTSAPNLTGEIEPQEGSPTQRLIAQGTHPDLHIIHKELARYHDNKQIRERKLRTIPKEVVEQHLLRPVALAPTIPPGAMAGKVFIIDEAELLDRSTSNAPVQNSMLKTLEEPPPGTVIILVTCAEELLLPTIRSRCQRIVFTPLPPEAMERWCSRAFPDLKGPERQWVLSYAQGSPGRAAVAVAEGYYQWHTTLDPMLSDAERGRYSPALGQSLAAIIDKWAKERASADAGASKEAANHAVASALLSLLAERWQGLLRRAAQAGSEAALRRALAGLDAIDRAERHITASVAIPGAMENLAAHLCAPAD
jgi:DNA polymerase-3 subunit delta'